MTKLTDGSTVSIHRDGQTYYVEHVRADGIMLDKMACDNLAEARAALEIGPSRW